MLKLRRESCFESLLDNGSVVNILSITSVKRKAIVTYCKNANVVIQFC